MRLRITIAMLEIRNRETLQSKVNICKSDVKIGDYADSLGQNQNLAYYLYERLHSSVLSSQIICQLTRALIITSYVCL